MLGRLILTPGERSPIRLDRTQIKGLHLYQVRTDPTGWLGSWRLDKAARLLRRRGVTRVLVPESFCGWEPLQKRGLRPVNPLPFLRTQGARLVLTALERQGLAPGQAVVGLCAQRVDRDFIHAAQLLAPQVRGLVLCAPSGGEELARQLQWEMGLPMRPVGEHTPVCLWLGGARPDWGGEVFSLREEEVDLAELQPGWEEITDLPTLTALWEAGLLPEDGLRFFDNRRGTNNQRQKNTSSAMDGCGLDIL